MNFKPSIIIAIFFTLFINSKIFAQRESEYIQGEVIIQLEKSFTDIYSIVKKNQTFEGVWVGDKKHGKFKITELGKETLTTYFYEDS